MTTEKISVKDKIQNQPTSPEITGHDLMALERFAEHNRHMIIFDVFSWECPVGDKGQRVRIFLTDVGYEQALRSQERGEMKIKKHARVRKGDLFYDSRTRRDLTAYQLRSQEVLNE